MPAESQQDADGDGVMAEEDLCPDVKGFKDGFGCPHEILGVGLPCSPMYGPVCGADGKIYVNTCVARGVGVEVAYYGRCRDVRPEDCPDEVSYVCGADMRDYKNACLAEAFGTKVGRLMRCEEGYGCPEVDVDYLPVCGYDGITYWDPCDIVGREIAYVGACIASFGLVPCPFYDDECVNGAIKTYRQVDYDMDGVPNDRDLCPDTGGYEIGEFDEYGCFYFEEHHMSTKDLLWVIKDIWDPDDPETLDLLVKAFEWWDPLAE